MPRNAEEIERRLVDITVVGMSSQVRVMNRHEFSTEKERWGGREIKSPFSLESEKRGSPREARNIPLFLSSSLSLC